MRLKHANDIDQRFKTRLFQLNPPHRVGIALLPQLFS
jgi:hypothetical protein